MPTSLPHARSRPCDACGRHTRASRFGHTCDRCSDKLARHGSVKLGRQRLDREDRLWAEREARQWLIRHRPGAEVWAALACAVPQRSEDSSLVGLPERPHPRTPRTSVRWMLRREAEWFADPRSAKRWVKFGNEWRYPRDYLVSILSIAFHIAEYPHLYRGVRDGIAVKERLAYGHALIACRRRPRRGINATAPARFIRWLGDRVVEHLSFYVGHTVTAWHRDYHTRRDAQNARKVVAPAPVLVHVLRPRYGLVDGFTVELGRVVLSVPAEEVSPSDRILTAEEVEQYRQRDRERAEQQARLAPYVQVGPTMEDIRSWRGR
jgi:hypothetical protein